MDTHTCVKGVEIKMVDDEDHTDLTKTIQHLLRHSKEHVKVRCWAGGGRRAVN